MTVLPLHRLPVEARDSVTAAAAVKAGPSAPLLRHPKRLRVGKMFATRALGWSAIAVLFVVWQIGVGAGMVTSPVLPAPRLILERWWALVLNGELALALGSTLKLMLLGYAAACMAGISAGVAMARFRIAFGLLEPFIELLRPIPITAIVPLLVLFLGIGDGLKIVAVFLAAFFPNVLNSYSGVRSVPRTLRETALTFGLPSHLAIRKIFIPYAMPQIFVGMRLALSISLIVAVFSEMISGNTGMGYFIFNSQQTLNVIDLYVGVFTLAAIGYLLNLLVVAVERVLLPWQIGSKRRPAT